MEAHRCHIVDVKRRHLDIMEQFVKNFHQRLSARRTGAVRKHRFPQNAPSRSDAYLKSLLDYQPNSPISDENTQAEHAYYFNHRNAAEQELLAESQSGDGSLRWDSVTKYEAFR